MEITTKTYKTLFFFISVLILLKFANTSLLFESRPFTIIQEEFKKEINKIQEAKSMSKIDLGTYPYEDPVLGSVIISDLKQEIQYFDVNRLTLSLEDTGNQVMTGENGTLKLQYSFKYKVSEDVEDIGTFTFDSTKYTVTKYFSLSDDKILQQNGKVDELDFISADINYQGDQSLQKLIESAIKELPKWSTPSLFEAYKKDFSDYYKSESGKRKVKTFTTYMPEIECTIDETRDKIPKKLTGNNLLFYLSGKLNKREEMQKEPLFDQDSSYQYFVHKELFNNLFTDMTKDGLFDFSVTKANRPSKAPFYLDIQSLGKIIPELYDIYSSDEDLKVYNKISSYEISPSTNNLAGFFTITTEIQLLKDLSTVFSFETKYSFSFKYSLSDMKLNFYIDDTNVNFVSLKLIKSNYKRVYKDTLRSWFDVTLKSVLSQKFFLFKTPSDLGNNFSQVSEVKFNQSGLLLKGVGKVPNYSTFEKRENSKFEESKFLN
jgi:hypothetical protein